MKAILGAILLAGAMLALAPTAALADGGLCPRPAAGSEAARPPDLYSKNGVLKVKFNYYTSLDDLGRTLFCFVTDDGLESPTLHVNPGDTIKISLTNQVPEIPGGPTEIISSPHKVCGALVMTLSSVNMHFHGTNTSPTCHSDEVIRTLVNSGQTFEYTLHIPEDEPPGLYWYHPHVHGISSAALQGGATGAIEVEGIADIQPAVAGLPERYLVLRDQQLIGCCGLTDVQQPNWDVSVNYVPVSFPRYVPAVIKMQEGTQEFWRVVNAGANTIMDIQVLYDGVPQPLQIAALDGVPTGSKDGRRQGVLITQTDILLPPSSRAEFIVAAPSASVRKAQLVTLAIDGGEASDSNPARPLANIVATSAPVALPKMPAPDGIVRKMRFDDLANAAITAHRDLYFSEYFTSFGHETEGAEFFITVDGHIETLFDPNVPPAITTHRGAVEEWRIENRTQEVHEFHMHQVHFLVTAVNDKPIPKKRQQLYDTFQVGYWDGNIKHAYPSITIKLDFRGPTVGDFVYHCHILDHEDLGMMAIIRVLPPEKGEGREADRKRSVREASAVAIRPAAASP
jgi:FtsP/CotA-like multicopper oxidase with cupredoxin domain